ncbi:MAG: YcgL domain-containing protein [Ferrimonas sp.]
MICVVYRSSKKAETYLYVNKRDDFSSVPEQLLTIFGVPQFVMVLPIAKLTKLGNADLTKVKQALAENGFYLQLPPPVEDLLKTHKQQLGIEGDI